MRWEEEEGEMRQVDAGPRRKRKLTVLQEIGMKTER